MTNLPPHPDQPIYIPSDTTDDRRPRFRANKIVEFLLRAGPFDLNQLSMMPWDPEDYTHLMQLIGYSVDGYGELSTSPSDRVKRADAIAAKLSASDL
jgi:hypothetical protein